MATKYTDLPAAAALDGSEVLAVVQGGDSVQTTTQDIANLATGGSGTTVHVDKIASFTVDKADTKKTYVMTSGSAIVATLPDLSAETVDYEWAFYVAGTGGGSFDPNGETSNNTAGNDNFSDQFTFMYLYYDHVANAYYISNGSAGAGGNLQDTLDLGSTAVIATELEIEKTGIYSFELLDTGINLITDGNPIRLSSITGDIALVKGGVNRVASNGNNNDYSSESTGVHRFYTPGAGAAIRLMEESGSGTNYIALKAPTDVTTAQTYTFPAAGPGTNGNVLASTTAGQLSWITPSGGTPADASETVKGILEISTQAETTTGTDDLRAVTPLKLAVATRGTQDLFISAAAMWPRVTGGCAELAKSELATSLFNIQSLDFDQTTQEFAQFQIVLPRKWNNGTVTVVFYWTASAGSGDVQWGISGGAYSNDDALTVALGTPQTVDDTLIAANDLHITSATSAITLAGTPADADFLAFQVSRNPGSDTLTADAKLLGISVRLTTDSALDA